MNLQNASFAEGSLPIGNMFGRNGHIATLKKKRKWYALHAIEYEDRSVMEVVKHPGDPHDWQVKCVDENCNNGWMRRLENAARPLLLPLILGDETPRFIGPKEQRLIATWVALKVIIEDHAPRGDLITHHKQIQQLWKKQQAPSRTWRIWLSRYDGFNPETLWQSHPMLILPDAVVARRRSRRATYFNSQAATYVIGKLFIHVIRCPYERLVREFRFHHHVAVKMARIWPPTGYDPRWPYEPLTDIEAGYLAWALRSFVRGDGFRSKRRSAARAHGAHPLISASRTSKPDAP